MNLLLLIPFLPVMPIVMRPEPGRLLKGHPTDVTAKVLLVAVKELVVLQRALVEESLRAEGAHETPTFFVKKGK
jgi:hypothetical protein